MVIILNLKQESSSQLAMGATFGIEPPPEEVGIFFTCAPANISKRNLQSYTHY